MLIQEYTGQQAFMSTSRYSGWPSSTRRNHSQELRVFFESQRKHPFLGGRIENFQVYQLGCCGDEEVNTYLVLIEDDVSKHSRV